MLPYVNTYLIKYKPKNHDQRFVQNAVAYANDVPAAIEILKDKLQHEIEFLSIELIAEEIYGLPQLVTRIIGKPVWFIWKDDDGYYALPADTKESLIEMIKHNLVGITPAMVKDLILLGELK